MDIKVKSILVKLKLFLVFALCVSPDSLSVPSYSGGIETKRWNFVPERLQLFNVSS